MAVLAVVCVMVAAPSEAAGVYFTNNNTSGTPPAIAFHELPAGQIVTVLPRTSDAPPVVGINGPAKNLDFALTTGRLYYQGGSAGEIYSIGTDGAGFQVFATDAQGGGGQDYDAALNRLFYFSDSGIRSVDLLNGSSSFVALTAGTAISGTSIHGLTVDSSGQRIYFADGNVLNSIGYDGLGMRVEFTLPATISGATPSPSARLSITDLDIDSVTGRVFWSFLEVAEVAGQSTFKNGIGWFDTVMGTSGEVASFEGLSIDPIRELLVDSDDDRVWWTSSGIVSARLDGSDLQRLFLSQDDPSGLTLGPSTQGYVAPPGGVPLPEPGTIALVAAALACVAARRRRG